MGIDTCKGRINTSSEKLERLSLGSMILITKRFESGKEHLVKFDITELVKRHVFYAKRVHYHAKNFIFHLESIKLPAIKVDELTFLTVDLHPLSYEFDSLLAALGSFTEQQFYSNIPKALSRDSGKELASLMPSKNDPNGFWWRMNVLRNRTVHPDSPMYNSSGNKFSEFSSSAHCVKIQPGKPIEIPVHLIDTKYSPIAAEIIGSKILPLTDEINANYKEEQKSGKHGNCRPVFPDFFKTLSKSGKKSNNPTMVISDQIDLINTFESIVYDGLNLIDAISNIYMKDIQIIISKIPGNETFDLPSLEIHH